ncbi:hypothetical protein ABQF35_29765 [Mycobacterium syngnathidarum]
MAKLLVAGGLLALALGGLRSYTYLSGRGGLAFLVIGLLFLGLGVLAIVVSTMRIRAGDPPDVPDE